MAMYAVVSPGGSPGATTSALALALAWPRPVIVAECDPAGGGILAGLFAGHLPAPGGLLGVALEAGRGGEGHTADIAGQLAPLDKGGDRWFLAGIHDPRQAPGLAPLWPAIGATLAGQDADVIADCGRLDAGESQPASVLANSSMIVLVMRASLRQVAAARPRIEMVAAVAGGSGRLRLLMVGQSGPTAREIARTHGVPIIGSLPDDVKTAALLSDGKGRRSGLHSRPLIRAAGTTAQAIIEVAASTEAAGQANAAERVRAWPGAAATAPISSWPGAVGAALPAWSEP
jgi:hypothetical protein